MRIGTLIFLFILSSVMLSSGVAADEDKKAMCAFKGDVASFAYLNRGKVSEQDMLKVLKRDWNENRQASWPYAAYVDSQRIVRDAHRQVAGKYRRECCSPEIAANRGVRAKEDCLVYGF